MHNLQSKLHTFIIFYAFIFTASIFMAVPQHLEAKDVKDKAITKLEQKKETIKEKHKKHKGKSEAEKKAEEKVPEVKKEEPKPTPPPPVTPDKKKYASPSGYQVMTDGRVVNFRSMGVIYMHGYRYTYYSSNVLRHHRTHEWYACDDHIYRTKEGYVVVASGNHAQGSIVPTPFGPGKVLDHCHVGGTIDIYVDF